MGSNAEAGWNGLEHFLLLVNAPPAPPPPSLVDERPMRRIHQPDDPVVDAQRQIGGQTRDSVRRTEDGEAWRRFLRFAAGARKRHVNPDVAILLFAGKMSGMDFFYVELRIFGKRRDRAAQARLCLEAPAVVVALELIAIEMPKRERHSPMRTTVSQREGATAIVAPDDQRCAEQHGGTESPAPKLAARKRGIPEAAEHFGVGG